MQHALFISSSTLWEKPASLAICYPVEGLWSSGLVPRSIETRHVTRRPERKLKHETFLPDIGMYFLSQIQSASNKLIVWSQLALYPTRETL